VTKVNSEKMMIQIIDISDKMLYNEVRAEQSFFTLMNAAVSHELRNPLASLIGGIETMKTFLENISQIIQTSKSEYSDELQQIYVGMMNCCQKMTSSANIIDFFVHDILDYTILTNDDKNFIKDLSIFDIREAVNQILVIIEDKAIMKKITMKTKYRGFRKRFNVKTD